MSKAYATMVALCFLCILISACEKKNDKKRTVIQEITVITPPPPPPPPPPPEDVIEPEVEEVIEEQLEEPTPEDAPPEPISQDLGIDADGTAGGDSFGLIGKKGGRGLLDSGGYGAYMRSKLQKAVMEDKKLSRYEYKALVKIWFAESGNVLRTEVVVLNGQKAAKRALERFIKKFPDMIKNKPLEAKENYYELRVSSLF